MMRGGGCCCYDLAPLPLFNTLRGPCILVKFQKFPLDMVSFLPAINLIAISYYNIAFVNSDR